MNQRAQERGGHTTNWNYRAKSEYAQPLDGARIRVERAQHHISSIDGRLEQFRRKLLPALNFRVEPDKISWNKFPVILPLELAALVGEVIYNLRAALDYVVFELAAADSGRTQHGTQFPIEDRPEKFRKRRKTFLLGVSDAHVSQIEALQPYRGIAWTAKLRELSNPDKHRSLTVLFGAGRGQVTIQYGAPGSFDERDSGVVRPATQEVPFDAHLKPEVLLDLTFDDETLVLDTLRDLRASVARTVDDFAKTL
jgi:hypothetical protein